MSDCIFCNIVSGAFASATLYENDEFKVILDRFPANEGHVLILLTFLFPPVMKYNSIYYFTIFFITSIVSMHFYKNKKASSLPL